MTASKIIKILLTLITFIFAFYLLSSAALIQYNDHQNRLVVKKLQNHINENKSAYDIVFTKIFPEADYCFLNSSFEYDYCERQTQDLINSALGEVITDSHGNRKPMFFIRLKNDNIIQKLYQGGGFKEEVTDTYPEKIVVEILKGDKNAFKYPLYNCCGGNDIVSELPVINYLLPPNIYLGNFYSEIEYIFTIKLKSESKIIGAIVYLYGD